MSTNPGFYADYEDEDDDDLPDSTDLDWYHGPENWHLADLPASLANFVTTVQGTLFSR